jgi:uncharacterized protein (TIGR02284 family)
MNFENGARIEDSVLRSIQQLIQANLDSGEGLQEAAADINEASLASMFRRWSVERFDQAEQLRLAVRGSNSRTLATGSWIDNWRRIWLSVRRAVNAGDRYTMLRQLERAESRMCQMTEMIMAEIRDPSLSEVIQQQLTRLRDSVETLRRLRTQAPVAASHRDVREPPVNGQLVANGSAVKSMNERENDVSLLV